MFDLLLIVLTCFPQQPQGLTFLPESKTTLKLQYMRHPMHLVPVKQHQLGNETKTAQGMVPTQLDDCFSLVQRYGDLRWWLQLNPRTAAAESAAAEMAM